MILAPHYDIPATTCHVNKITFYVILFETSSEGYRFHKNSRGR